MNLRQVRVAPLPSRLDWRVYTQMERSEELRSFALLYCQAIASGDLGFLERHISREIGLLVIGTECREWRVTYATAIDGYAAQLTPGAGRVVLVAADPQAHREGSVGWTADRATIRLPDAREIPCRLTLVWHQEDGRWKIVQHHLSLCVDRAHSIARP